MQHQGHLSTRLSQLAFFQSLTPTELDRLAAIFEVGRVDEGELLCQEGRKGDALYIIDKGQVRVEKRVGHGFDEALRLLGSGAVVGEMALLDGLPMSATVRAIEPTSVLRLKGSSLAGLRKRSPRITAKLFRSLCQVLCERLRMMNTRLRWFQANPEGLQAFIRQAHERGAPPSEPPTIPIPAQAVVPYQFSQAPDSADKIRFLRQLTLFKGMNSHVLSALAGLLSERRCAPGEVICTEGELGDRLYIVASGFVDVLKAIQGNEHAALTMLPPGTLFGEVALIDGKRRSASCVAKGSVGLLTLTRSDFDALFTAESPLANRFVEMLAFDLSMRLRVAHAQFSAIFAPATTDMSDFDDIGAMLEDVEGHLRQVEGRLQASVLTTHELELAVDSLFDEL